ncbi:MAG TPA: hypothetical protein VMW16_00010 [Sedimentisphaerales bacterium]|nr:hypothetical protein [Sedimentisphaerales bacterium]
MCEHYEVWVTLEKWNGDEKVEDCETTKIANVKTQADATVIWELCEAASLAVTPIVANNFSLSIED